jgi:hypothetical protein
VQLTISTRRGGVPKHHVIQALMQHVTMETAAAAFAAKTCDLLDAAHTRVSAIAI